MREVHRRFKSGVETWVQVTTHLDDIGELKKFQKPEQTIQQFVDDLTKAYRAIFKMYGVPENQTGAWLTQTGENPRPVGKGEEIPIGWQAISERSTWKLFKFEEGSAVYWACKMCDLVIDLRNNSSGPVSYGQLRAAFGIGEYVERIRRLIEKVNLDKTVDELALSKIEHTEKLARVRPKRTKKAIEYALEAEQLHAQHPTWNRTRISNAVADKFDRSQDAMRKTLKHTLDGLGFAPGKRKTGKADRTAQK